MNAKTSLRIAAAAIIASLAACAPSQRPITTPAMVDDARLSRDAVADGHVFEYHSTMEYPMTARTAVADAQVFEYH